MSFMLLLDVLDIYFIHLVVKETGTLSLFTLFCYGCYGDMNNSRGRLWDRKLSWLCIVNVNVTGLIRLNA